MKISSYPSVYTTFSPGMRRFAWLNISVLKVAFPLMVVFTPLIAGAGEQQFLQQTAPLSAQRTQVYPPVTGEFACSVAKKFHLTFDQFTRSISYGP